MDEPSANPLLKDSFKRQNSGNDIFDSEISSERYPLSLTQNGGNHWETTTADRNLVVSRQRIRNGNENNLTSDAHSIRSVETHAPPPTSPEDNKKLSSKYLTLIMSCIYAIFLVTFGLAVYIVDPLTEAFIASGYSVALCLVGIIYHLYLMIDINRHRVIIRRNVNIAENNQNSLEDNRDEEQFGDDLSQRPTITKHSYCFKQGRHAGSFYLKLGAAIFAFGHLVHSVLLVAVQVGFYFDKRIDNEHCVDIMKLVYDVLSPTYCFIQLYFIFNYSNIIILRSQGLANFAFMHMIGSSICFWICAIVRETILALTIYAKTKYGNSGNGTVTYKPVSTVSNKFKIDISGLANTNCEGPDALTSIYKNFSPYLFPFTVEFNIFIVAAYYIIWSNIGQYPDEQSPNVIGLDENAYEDKEYTSNFVIHADCHGSNKGLFMGMAVMVVVLGMLILGFVFSSFGGEFLTIGYLLNDCTRLGLHVIMLIATVIAFNQTRKLDINEHPISILDDILLFICLPAFFLETVFSLTAVIPYRNYVKSLDFIFMIIQVLIQTPLLIDGLRRCSNTRRLRRVKPGRDVTMFLLIANVGVWFYYTFSYKSPDSLDERYAFYGKVLWTILGHINLPLIMFYRFHSSVCYSDIWSSAYKAGSEH